MSVLFISKKNTMSKNLLDYMQKELEIHECDFASDVIRRTIRIMKPDVIFVIHDVSYSDKGYINLLDDANEIPIIIMCEKDDDIVRKRRSSSIRYLFKPVSAKQVVAELKAYSGTKKDEAETGLLEKNESISPASSASLLNENGIDESIIKEFLEEDTTTDNGTGESESQRKKILAVDDNAQVLRAIKSILKEDYDVSLAPSVMVAIEQLDNKKFDLIILDYEMPEIDGLTALQLIKTDVQLKDIPVVFLTGVSDRERIMKVVQYKPEAYLLKPIDASQLKEIVVDLIK